ncbi:MAG TPA: AAA family ATPase [Candidatus Saccharimonadales bacterium]|nr:AAA family ATPase [Candidatus Saccharimonadales bacterium]
MIQNKEQVQQVVQELQSLDGPWVAMGIGMIGVGKTALLEPVAKQLDVDRVCLGGIRYQLTGSEADPSQDLRAWRIAHGDIEAAVRRGDSVIVDAAFTQQISRARNVLLYRNFGAVTVAGIHIEAPLNTAILRDRARGNRSSGAGLVRKTDKELRIGVPVLADGFDKLIRVKVG